MSNVAQITLATERVDLRLFQKLQAVVGLGGEIDQCEGVVQAPNLHQLILKLD